MSKIIVVDDIRLSADKQATHAVNTVEALRMLIECEQKGEIIDELWLDYDMSNNKGIGDSTTVPVATWLIKNSESRVPLIIKELYIHSSHPNVSKLVEMLEPYFVVNRSELPNSMWWEQPEEATQPAPEETR